MLEKIFGKKSTGIVCIVCAAILLLTYAGAAAAYVFWDKGTLLSLVGFTLYTAFELALVSLPVFVQKKFRLYIPPAVEIGICLYSVLFLLGISLRSAQNSPLFSLTAPVGGFTVAMTVFSVLYTPAAARAQKKGKKTPALRLTLLTLGISFFIILLYVLTSWVFALVFAEQPPENIVQFLSYAGDVDTQRIVIHIELVIPKEIYNVATRTDFSSVLKKVVKNLCLIFGQFNRLPTVFNDAALQMQSGIIPDKYLGCLRNSICLSQKRGDFGKKNCCIIWL